MLAPDVRMVAIELLRPPEGGYRLDQAILTTYSLDLETLLALPLAVLAHADQGVEALLADPLLLIEGLREAGSRLHVFVDAGGMAIPRTRRELYALLEPCVHPVRARHGGAFHPKVWIARFVDRAGQVRLRVAVLSRNLTFDRSWDVAFASEGSPERETCKESAALAVLLRGAPELSQLNLPAEVAATAEALAQEVERTVFPGPEGFEGTVRFHTLGMGKHRSAWAPHRDAMRVLAIAPFLKASPLEFLGQLGNRCHSRTLIATQEQLDKLPNAVLEPWTAVLVLADAAHDEVNDPADEGASPRPSGLHAKAIAIEHGHDVTWWVGSANLTDAAWSGSNVEVMAEVTGRKGREVGQSGQGISRFLESGFRALCQEYQRSEPATESERTVAARRTLAEARNALVQAELIVTCEQSDKDWSWRLTGDLDPPDGVQVDVWPVSVNEANARPLELPVDWVLPIVRLTTFVAFRLQIPGSGVDAERFTRKLQGFGIPEGRINHVLRELINSPERLLRFLQALLGGLEGLVDWGLGQGGDAQGQWEVGLGGEALLEDLVRAASRDPGRLDPIRQILNDLNSTDEGRQIIPDGLMETWQAVEQALAVKQK